MTSEEWICDFCHGDSDLKKVFLEEGNAICIACAYKAIAEISGVIGGHARCEFDGYHRSPVDGKCPDCGMTISSDQ